MNVNSTTKVDAATTVSIPPGVFIANAQQVFSWTKRGSARVIQLIQMFLNRCLMRYCWLLCFILSPFKIYKNSLVFSKIYWSHRNNNLGQKPRHMLHYRHLTFIIEIDHCYLYLSLLIIIVVIMFCSSINWEIRERILISVVVYISSRRKL